MTVYRITTGMEFAQMANDIFGEDARRLSYIYLWAIKHMDQAGDGVVHGDSLSRWAPSFTNFNRMIKRAARRKNGVDLSLIRPCCLLDCSGQKTTTPGTGPDQNGDRHADSDALQGAVYSGYFKYHSIKVQTIVLPTGIIGNVYGPCSIRENDLWYANQSGINQYMMDMQPNVVNQQEYFCALGDGIYVDRECIKRRHVAPAGGVLTPQQIAENEAIKSIREYLSP